MALFEPLSDERREALVHALTEAGFTGDIEAGLAARLTAGTDNSIYQLLPALVLHPRSGEDINRAVRVARTFSGGPVPIQARGGGTGTNGQSLGNGITLDTSRHLNRILHLDVEAGTVTVEPGVVLDQLNAFLGQSGLFFPPMVSTASRATIGGMVATDASGKGSRIYGKTSDHILALDLVLADGSDWTARRLDADERHHMLGAEGLVGDIHRAVDRVVREKAALIEAIFPRMNRGMTGYNLQGVTRDGGFDLTRLLAGSEGTLALTKSITLALRPKPKHRALIVARYNAFDTALRDVRHLLAAEPSAIEVLDDKVLAMAREDILWCGIETVLGGPAAAPVMGLSFIEFLADDTKDLDRATEAMAARLATSDHPAMDWRVVRDSRTIDQLWSLREKAVGLLGRMGGRRQGTPFVEDTAVPPERLADYVRDFRAILDSHGLVYGMFGHADVGCLHVRPALDMADPADAALIRPISDAVAALTKSYGGLLWGEHGRGYRGEFSPFFFGNELYQELCQIKRAFDPLNLLNPGKLATPDASTVTERIDAVPLRGAANRQIAAALTEEYDRAIACNGNAACHSWDALEPMCPSFKATGDRVQSPKGRATVLRAWARLSSQHERGLPAPGLAALEEEVKASLDTCLSCKACASQCPVKVDVPAMKSRFLAGYYRSRRRPARDHLMARMEIFLGGARRFPRLANAALSLPLLRQQLRNRFNLVDLPVFAPTRMKAPTKAGRPVILLRDSFVASFDGAVEAAAVRLLEKLGYAVTLSPVWINGKAAQVLGMPEHFRRAAQRAQALRVRLGATGIPLVSLDAATGLLFEQEYQAVAPLDGAPAVLSFEQFLIAEIEAGHIARRQPSTGLEWRILLHCTERTARPETGARWQRIFAHFGIPAVVPALGCCGMAGMFGHEAEHAGLSRQIFDLSWARETEGGEAAIAITGFSCRCQVKRFAGVRPPHPVEILLESQPSPA